MTTKNNKKSKKSQNKIVTIVKIGVVLAIISVLLIGIAVTTKQYIAYKSLDKKVGEMAKLLEQSGIENITKKDECDYENKLGPISCNISLSVSYEKLTIEEVDKKFNKFISIIDNQNYLSFHSKLSDNINKGDDVQNSVTILKNNGLGYRGECSARINASSGTLDGTVVCGYDAWWKQIL